MSSPAAAGGIPAENQQGLRPFFEKIATGIAVCTALPLCSIYLGKRWSVKPSALFMPTVTPMIMNLVIPLAVNRCTYYTGIDQTLSRWAFSLCEEGDSANPSATVVLLTFLAGKESLEEISPDERVAVVNNSITQLFLGVIPMMLSRSYSNGPGIMQMVKFSIAYAISSGIVGAIARMILTPIDNAIGPILEELDLISGRPEPQRAPTANEQDGEVDADPVQGAPLNEDPPVAPDAEEKSDRDAEKGSDSSELSSF